MSATAPHGRFGALATRLLLLGGVVGGVGLLIGILALPAALATADVLNSVERDVLDLPPLGEADTPPRNSYVYAADGTELAELNFEENRVPVTLEQIPQVAVDAVLATEDTEFYEHSGVNHSAIVRAAVTNLRSGNIESGASTITQQYVKSAFLSPEQTIARKVQEAIYAIELERQVPKDQILERYLNRSYFGSGVYGIGTAAERYFSTPVEDLSLGQAATLAGLLRAPEANNPINSSDNAAARRDVVLRQMALHGYVTDDQADAAIDQPLEPEISEPPAPQQPAWVEWVSRLLVEPSVAEALGSQTGALEEMGATFEERRQTVFQSGLRIHTTLDLELQEAAEASLRDHLTYEDEPADEVAQEPMGAIVSVEPETGAIVTMALGPRDYGSCSEDDSWVGTGPRGELLCDRTQVNPAVPTDPNTDWERTEGRQPGSSMKPLLVTAALEDGVSPAQTIDGRVDPATGYEVIEGCTNDGEEYRVRNSGGNGVFDMYEAIKQSSNVWHTKLIEDIGPDRLLDVADRFGIETADHVPGCALALGAGPTTPLEMASAYATFANRGTHCQPFPISRIEDANGEVIWEHDVDCAEVIDTDVADRAVDIMAGPVEPGGTAPEADLGAWPTRGKTGTTSAFVDAWFVGYVQQLATASWIGYANGTLAFATEEEAREVCGDGEDETHQSGQVWVCPEEDPQTLRNVTIGGQDYARVFGATINAPMWADYMSDAVQRFEPASFPDPGPLPTELVPNVLRAGSVAAAERIAEEAGFRLTARRVEDSRAAGRFVGQSPSAGAQAPLGTRIVLQVSDGSGFRTSAPEPSSPSASVPNVRGMTLDQAANALTSDGYGVSRVDVEVQDPSSAGHIVGQSPGAGTELPPFQGGSSVVVLRVGVAAPEDDPPPADPPPADPPPADPPPAEPPRDDPPSTDPPSDDVDDGDGDEGEGEGEDAPGQDETGPDQGATDLDDDPDGDEG